MIPDTLDIEGLKEHSSTSTIPKEENLQSETFQCERDGCPISLFTSPSSLLIHIGRNSQCKEFYGIERIEKMRKELKNARQRKSYSNMTPAQRESRLEQMRSSQQTQYGKHSEEEKLRKRTHYGEHSEEEKLRKRSHYDEHSEEEKLRKRTHYDEHSEEKKLRQRTHYGEHSEKEKLRKRTHYDEHSEEKKIEAMHQLWWTF